MLHVNTLPGALRVLRVQRVLQYLPLLGYPHLKHM